MCIPFKAKIYLPLLVILAIGLLWACANPALPATPPSATPPPDKPSESPVVSPVQNEPSNTPDRVDVVYFHRPQRCPTCLCFEERVTYVVKTYFQDQLNSGKLTFQVYNIGDSKNADVVKKYGAVGSQLFINNINDNTDHIRDIKEIWSWNCRSNKQGFDQKVKSAIEQSLKGEE